MVIMLINSQVFYDHHNAKIVTIVVEEDNSCFFYQSKNL